MELSPKRRRFVEEYLIDLNAAQAAVRAGYSTRNADTVSHRLMQSDSVKAAISEGLKAKAEAAAIKAEAVVKELAVVGFSNVDNFLTFPDGEIVLRSSETIPREIKGAISEISSTHTQHGTNIKLKLHNKVNALETLSRLLGFFPEQKKALSPDNAIGAYSELVRLTAAGALSSRWTQLIENQQGQAFSLCRKRFQVVAAGRRSGKDERSKRKVIQLAALGSNYPNPRYALCAPTLGQAKQIFWNDLKLMIPRKFMACDPIETELTVKLINGAELCVRGLDKPQRIEGSPWDGFVFSETDDMKRGFWEEHLRPCLSDRLGWAIFNGVPEGFGVLYDLRQVALQNPDEWAFFTWPSSEVIAKSEIDSARATLDERSFRQEYEASFENALGLIYYAFSRNGNVAPVPAAIAAGPLGAGLDFNVNPMSAVIFTEDAEKTYVVDEIVIPNNSNTDAVVAEIRRRYGARCNIAYPDPTGRKGATNAPVGRSDHEILRQAGLQVLCRGTVPRRDSQNALNSRLCSADGRRRLVIDPKCKHLIEALERHEAQGDGFDHITDALKYPMEFLHPVRERQSWDQ
jgi:phage terminase small subunit